MGTHPVPETLYLNLLTRLIAREDYIVTPAVFVYKKEVTHTLFMTRSYLHIADILLESRPCHRLSCQVVSVSASTHIPGKYVGYVTTASFDILSNSFTNRPTTAVLKFREPDRPGD
jgi:hypothetical protein